MLYPGTACISQARAGEFHIMQAAVLPGRRQDTAFVCVPDAEHPFRHQRLLAGMIKLDM